MSFDAYATFIENIFIGGVRFDPAALGNPDNRPDLRDALTQIVLADGKRVPVGDLRDEFDFKQAPLPPVVLTTHIPVAILAQCKQDPITSLCTTNHVTLLWHMLDGGPVDAKLHFFTSRATAAHCRTARALLHGVSTRRRRGVIITVSAVRMLPVWQALIPPQRWR